MSEQKFSTMARKMVEEYYIDHNNPVSFYDIYIVWNCKILQNNKCLLSTPIEDGLYFEITYNGDKKEFYVDVYKKQETHKIKEEQTNDIFTDCNTFK